MSSTMPPSVAYEKSIINTGLNSGMLFAFFMGAYTVIHFGTLYLYLTRRATQRLLVAGTMTAMWMLASTLLGSIWFGMNFCIVAHGDTREDISRCAPPSWIILLQDLTEFPIIAMADGILVWRCFHVWNRSLRATAFPLFLTIVEIGSFIAAVVAISVDRFAPSPPAASVYNSIIAAAFFLSFVCTLVTTFLIGIRIWSLSRQRNNSKGRYRHVVEILIQSSATYALAMLVQAIEGFLPESIFRNHPGREWALQNYVTNIVYPVACIAPTIMVARVALLDSDNMHTSTTRVLSDLEFQLRSTRLDDTTTRLDTTLEVEGNNSLPTVVEKDPSK